MHLGPRGEAQFVNVARVVKVSPYLNFLKPDGGDLSTYYSARRLGLLAYCAFPNCAWATAGESLDRQRVPDERAETLWREFVAGEAVADGLGGSGGVCPRFVRDQWVAAQEKGARARERARAAAEKALAPASCAPPAATQL